MRYACLILLAMLISIDRLAAAAEAVKKWAGRYVKGVSGTKSSSGVRGEVPDGV